MLCAPRCCTMSYALAEAPQEIWWLMSFDVWAVSFLFGGQWHRLRFLLGFMERSKFCSSALLTVVLFSGRPIVVLLNMTSREVYSSYGRLKTQGLLVLTLIEELILSMTVIEDSSQGEDSRSCYRNLSQGWVLLWCDPNSYTDKSNFGLSEARPVAGTVRVFTDLD